jgi:transcriptional regulator with XRE-family HTH domain
MESRMIATGAQIRAARALLDWTRAELAAASGLHKNAVAYWEKRDQITEPGLGSAYALERIAEALLKAGVKTFTSPAPGVRLCRRTN